MHIDLATQDIHTLARNAVAAGASLVAEFDDLYVLRSPGGVLLCSVGWDDECATAPAPLPISILLRPSGHDADRAVARLDLACSDREATRADHERHGAITVDSAAHSTSLRDPAGGTYLLTDRDPLAAT